MLTLLAVAICCGVVEAWIQAHNYTESGSQSTPITPAYTGKHYVHCLAPTSGSISAWFLQIGEHRGQVNKSNGASGCNIAWLTSGFDDAFQSEANIMSGTAKATGWDSQAPSHPACPDPTPNGPDGE